MTILYINDEHCTSVEQLRSYFSGSLSYESPVFFELIDYARAGEISSWLREKGESLLADNVDSIDGSLGDRDYFLRLFGVMTGVDSNQSDRVLEKPDFSQCYNVEGVQQEQEPDGIVVNVQLKVLSSVNEPYEICVRTSWGNKVKVINPFKEKVGGILQLTFSFRKRPYVEFEDVVLLVDEKELKDVKYTGLGGEVLEFEVGSCRFKMIRVEGGTFMMGATEEMENPTNEEKPVHEVTLTNDYYIGETQVTQALWKEVKGSNPSYFRGDDLPVENVSWYACQDFIRKLNSLTGRRFRLPTEAEWEFAARGGNKSKHTQYSGNDNIDEVAWGWINSGNKYWRRPDSEWSLNKIKKSKCRTHPVKTKKANELGLFDMAGNVWEWCSDRSGRYSNVAQTNPKGSKYGKYRVCRGGSWYYHCSCCRSSFRNTLLPNYNDNTLGLRLVLSE